jgi:hypothetical protein
MSTTQAKATDDFGNEESIPKHIESKTRDLFEANPPLGVRQITCVIGFWGSSDISEADDILNYALDRLRARRDGEYGGNYSLDAEIYQSGRRAFKRVFEYEPMGERQ